MISIDKHNNGPIGWSHGVAAVVIREVTGADRDHVVDLFEGLSAHDRFVRFFRPMPEYLPSVLDLLTAMDGVDHVAVGAFVGDACVGVARYIRLRHDRSSAELAMTIAQNHRGAGIARRLLAALDAHAAGGGIETFEITVHPENRSASAAFRGLGFTTRFNDGSISGTRPAGPAVGGRTLLSAA